MTVVDAAQPLLGKPWAAVEAAAAKELADIETRVARWVWAAERTEWEVLAPLWVERRGERPGGGVLAAAPENVADAVLYGYGAGGELLIARRFRDGAPGDPDIRDYVVRVPAEDGTVLQLCFFHPFVRSAFAELRRIERATISGDRVVAVDVWSAPPEEGAHMREEYIYAEDRLTRIEYSFRALARPDVLRHSYEVGYDGEGRLQTIVKQQTGKADDVVYRASSTAAVRNARKRIVARLADGVIAWANRVELQMPACAIAIAYDAESGAPLPPSLGVITKANVSGAPSRVPEDLWNPAEFPGFDVQPAEFDDPDLLEDCRTLNQAWASTLDTDAVRKLLVETAKQVNARRNEIRIESLGELAIYAVDLELVDLQRNLRATVSPTVIENITQLARSPRDADD
jgi:hypothetical protein